VALDEELPMMLERLAELTGDRPVDLFVAPHRGPLRCWADAARLEQALGNLLATAAERSPPRAKIRVNLSAGCRPGTRACAFLSVHDRGAPPDERDDGSAGGAGETPLADSPADSVAGSVAGSVAESVSTGVGAGLHLFFARRLVELQGGTLAVTSPDDGGMTVTVELPLFDAAEAPALVELASSDGR
jgi:signal transduction histidine kinase